MWQQAASGVNPNNTFNVTDGNGANITLNSFPVVFNGTKYYNLSTPVQLSAYSSNNTTFHVNYVNGSDLFIGISTNGLNPFNSSAAPNPNGDPFKYMYMEATITGAQSDATDLTAINYASFPLNLATYQAGAITAANQLQQSSWPSGSSSTSIINALSNAVGAANIVTDGAGNAVRVLGPSQQYNADNNTTTYATFQPLLGKLFNQQNDTNAPNYGAAIKLTYTGNGGYCADALVTSNASGYYGLIITNVVANKGQNQEALTNPNTGTALTGALILNPDSATNQPLAVTIYSGVIHGNAGIWTGDLATNHLGKSLQSTLLASLSTAIVTGFAGSTTLFPGTTNEYRSLDANQWFTQNSPTATTNPGLFFNQLQPTNGGYYDPYFAAVSDLSGNSMYGSPYADRMANWTVALNSTAYGANDTPYSNWTPVSTMVLTIGSTNSVPEPPLYPLFGLGIITIMLTKVLHRRLKDLK